MAEPYTRLVAPTPLKGDDSQDYPYIELSLYSFQGTPTTAASETVDGIEFIDFGAEVTLLITYYRLESQNYFWDVAESAEVDVVRKYCIQNGRRVERLFSFPRKYEVGPTGSQQAVDRINAFADLLFKVLDANYDNYYQQGSRYNLFEQPYSSGSSPVSLYAELLNDLDPTLAGITTEEDTHS